MKNYEKLIVEARLVALAAHSTQMYDIFPYIKHIDDVVDTLKNFGFSGDDIIGGYLHDTVEDGALTYNKILKAFGLNVAEIVLACTDPSDARSRKEKKERVIVKLNAYPKAKPTKLADRFANVEHGIRMNNWDKLRMYVGEYHNFKERVQVIGEYDNLWAAVDEIHEKASSIIDNKY